MSLAAKIALAMDDAPQRSPAEEEALIEGFWSGKGMDELRFVEVLRPLMRRQVRRRWPLLCRQTDDLEQHGLEGLLEMRRRNQRPVPPLVALIAKLLEAEAKRRLRDLQRYRSLPEKESGETPSVEAALDGQRLLRLMQQLPEDQVAVLIHQAAHVEGDGAPLAAVLGVTPEQARKRLAYARKLLYALAYPEETAEVAHV